MFDVGDIQIRLIEALSHRASLCSVIFKAWLTIGPDVAVGARELTAAAHLSHADEVGTSEILGVLERLYLLEGIGTRWKPKAKLMLELAAIAMNFEAIEIYRSRVQKDATEVELVATRPGSAVSLDRELANAGWQTPRPEETDESIGNLFAKASRSIVVMTPFLDIQGGSILKALLDRVGDDVEITLILRYLDRPERDDYPRGFPAIVDILRKRRVRVFNYSLTPNPSAQVETFHAKLFLVDGARAYIGSANMTGSSFERSVELGAILSGAAARQLSRLVDAVIRCATPWPVLLGAL